MVFVVKKILSFLLFCSILYAKPPKILTSIAPVHSIVLNITDGITKPEILLTSKDNPHTINLSFQHIKKIKNADLIVWIGKELEYFLPKPIKTYDKKNFKLMDIPQMRLLSLQQQHNSCSHNINPHLWLDINNMICFARALGNHLASIDSKNSAAYTNNVKRTIAKLESLKKEIAIIFAHTTTKYFVALHNAYGYMETLYNIHNLGRISACGKSLSINSYTQIINGIKQHCIKRIFVETQNASKIEYRIAKDMGITITTIDPLGTGITVDTNHYFTLMHSLAQTITME